MELRAYYKIIGGIPVAKVSEFELQSHFVYFRTNNLRKGIKLLHPPSYVLDIITAVLLQGLIKL